MNIATQDLTHAKLVNLAAKWLHTRRVKRCGVVVAEIMSASVEQPDAIGWYCGFSTVVECKMSRSDFLADREKSHRKMGRTLGTYRYYLAPKGLLKPDDVATDGLLEAYWDTTFKRFMVNCVKQAEQRFDISESALRDEICILTSAVRRMKQREFIRIIESDDVTEQPSAKEGK